MERYVLLLKTPKNADVSEFRRRAEELAGEFGFKAELHRCIGLTVDGVVIYNNGVVLIKRKGEPVKGLFALPGGFV